MHKLPEFVEIYCNTETTDNAVQINYLKAYSHIFWIRQFFMEDAVDIRNVARTISTILRDIVEIVFAAFPTTKVGLQLYLFSCRIGATGDRVKNRQYASFKRQRNNFYYLESGSR
jgi:hypothetical protein